MLNACPFSTSELVSAGVYVAALRNGVTTKRMPPSKCERNKHHPNSHGHAPSLPFLFVDYDLAGKEDLGQKIWSLKPKATKGDKLTIISGQPFHH